MLRFFKYCSWVCSIPMSSVASLDELDIVLSAAQLGKKYKDIYVYGRLSRFVILDNALTFTITNMLGDE